jgi:Glycosyl transferase family 2
MIGIIVIGRNEGERLRACLASLPREGARTVYVDSGSTDGSVEVARAAAADVVMLDLDRPFTAARARNAGLAALAESKFDGTYIQFIDGDCTLDPGWIDTARAFLDSRPDVSVVCGRRRERHPDASVYNRLCDLEWDWPVGETILCGGDALMRRNMLERVGGYNGDLIAGEEPELCTRIRAAGGKIWRLGVEMTLHDAAMTRLSQWWLRAKRGGFAYAQVGSVRQPGADDIFAKSRRSALIWGGALPLAGAASALISPLLPLGAAGVVAAQIARTAARRPGDHRWLFATSAVLAKVPEALGIAKFWWQARRGREHRAIFYK